MTALLRQLDRVLDRRALARALLVLAPVLAAALNGGDPLWMPAALAAASSFIAMEEAGLAPLGVALHGLAIAAGFLILLTALPYPPLFALAAAAIAAAAILITAKGHRLRTPGNFVFIPALYIACELAEIGRTPMLQRGFAFLPHMAFAFVPVLLLSAVEYVPNREEGIPYLQHLVWLGRRKGDFGRVVPVTEGTAAIIGAVATAALLVEWCHVAHAQWVVWSAASVVTGDVASARRKLGDRAVGALIGVPLGLVLALAAPQASWMLRSAAIGGLLTLIIFRIYPIAFGTRCSLITLGLSLAGEPSGAATRLENVLTGGAIGLAFVLLAHASANFIGRRLGCAAAIPNSKGVQPCHRLIFKP